MCPTSNPTSTSNPTLNPTSNPPIFLGFYIYGVRRQPGRGRHNYNLLLTSTCKKAFTWLICVAAMNILIDQGYGTQAQFIPDGVSRKA